MSEKGSASSTPSDCTPAPADKGPCWAESGKMYTCVNSYLKSKDIFDKCEPSKQEFDQCIDAWRQQAGPDAKIRGGAPGLPPPQCQAMSGLIEKCLLSTSYNFEVCNRSMKFFKHCVKGLYGSEHVD